MFFGEKVRPGASGQAVLTMPDLTVTLVYLLGIPISREIGGQVAWDVLAPDLASRLPPRTRSSSDMGGAHHGGKSSTSVFRT
jgi:hypothetical protein